MNADPSLPSPFPDLSSVGLAINEHASLPTVTVAGANHLVRYANHAFCSLVGKPADQLIGRPFAEMIQEPDDFVTRLDRVYKTGKSENHVKRVNVQLQTIFWTYTMWPVMAKNSLLGVMIQVTEGAQSPEQILGMNEALVLGALRQHELTEAAEKLNAQLQLEITERSRLERETQLQTEALADLHRRKDEFLAMLSHELRNPLAPISNAMHLLRLQKNEDPIQIQARGIIERQVGQMTRLIDDLMEVSRISSGRIHLRKERLALRGIVENAVETARPLIDQHHHVLELTLPSAPVWLLADAARLEQVMVNLLANAAKYTEDGGSISLSVQQELDEAVIRVTDSGVGIAPELLPHVFDLFTQAERSLARSQGGLGIGLSLVQQLVKMHQGTVEAHSTLGKGSEFVVRLPVTRTSAPASLPAIGEAASMHRSLRVLLVEDNVDAAQTLKMLLELCGHVVRTVHNGLSALGVALDYQPQVVLLDIGLPGLNGFEVAKQLRQQPSLDKVVLVAMTGYGERAARQRSQETGFDFHLVKPADFDKLQEILASVSDKMVLRPEHSEPGNSSFTPT